MAPRPTRDDITEAADVLRRLVAALEAGTMTASSAMTARFQGAVVALESQLGQSL